MQNIRSVRGCTVPENGWPQIQMEEMEIHLARFNAAMSDTLQRMRADCATDITGRSNTVNIPYPSTYTTGHSDGKGIEASQETQLVLGTEI